MENCISIGATASHHIDITTKQIAYKNQDFALLRCECSLSNEYYLTIGLYAVVCACAMLENYETFRFTLKIDEAIHCNNLNENLLFVCIYQDSTTILQIDSFIQYHSH
ncbi:unnamed protein product [Rotaria sp. Silwood2]|nr:unnamed protein product [Rotaria sp. Silwood2]CAF4665689.1 unnamed protein product [Rotaria sp. Silwood2]